MVLMSLIGAAVAYSVVKGGSQAIGKYGKNANPTLNNQEYDRKNGINGLKIIGEQNIMNIAARCGIHIKNGVLPKYGYKHCLDYVSQYVNNELEIQTFITQWKQVSEQQEKRQSKQMTMCSTNSYHNIVNMWDKKVWERNRTIILEFNHWYNLTMEEHRKKAMDIYDHTYFGDIAIKQPVIRSHPKIYGKRTEYWEIQATKGARQEDWSTINQYKALYNQCCKYRGYQP